MKKDTFLILAMMVLWLTMIIRSFFGWSRNKNNQDTQPHSSDTWFVDTLTNTWDNQDNPSTTPEETNTPEKDYTEINIMMPKYFYTTGRENFKDDLYDKEKVLINFIFIDDLNSYRDDISNENFSDADIVLFPYDWYELVSTQSFSFQKSLKPVFDDFISPIIQDTDTSFLPFAVDPMIIYIVSESTLNNFSEISDFINQWTSRKPMSFPIFFGITDEDYYNKWFSREYQDIVRYALLHYFTTYHDDDNLTTRIDINNITIWDNGNQFENYNVSNLNTISGLITAPECKYFPSICFQLYNFVWLRFGFLSDMDVIKTYFQSSESKFSQIKKQNFPFYKIESPVRIWWWSIPNSLEDIDTINAVYRFLVRYMNSHDEYNLRNSTLSPFKKDWYSVIDNAFIWFRWYLLTTWWNYLENLRNTRAFWQLLDYEISAENYFKKI